MDKIHWTNLSFSFKAKRGIYWFYNDFVSFQCTRFRVVGVLGLISVMISKVLGCRKFLLKEVDFWNMF